MTVVVDVLGNNNKIIILVKKFRCQGIKFSKGGYVKEVTVLGSICLVFLKLQQ